MTTQAVSTRRSFIRTAGTALSAPLAVAAANTPVSAVGDADPMASRLGMLEDANAIRALNQAFARHVNAGADEAIAGLFSDAAEARIDPAIRSIMADGFGEQDAIDIAPDRQTATGVIHCTVETETAIGPSCPLVEMARQQGGGVIRRSETGVFEQAYVKRDGVWKILRSTYHPAT